MNRYARISKKYFEIQAVVLVILLFLSLFVCGCKFNTITTRTPTPQELKRFSARTESEDGTIIAWNGYTAGYEPGKEATFGITIKNETDQDWHGRYCLNLLAGQSHKVIATLEQREFTLQNGVGFSDDISVRWPVNLKSGAYGLSMVVRRPAGPMVDLVPIQIGETEETRRVTTQEDMDASLAACPPVNGANSLLEMARAENQPSGGQITIRPIVFYNRVCSNIRAHHMIVHQ